MRNAHSIHVRLNPNDDEQRKAWESLTGMDRERHQSYNKVIARAINAYFEQCEQSVREFTEADKALIDIYVNQIVSLVNDTLKETLPVFLAGCLAVSANAMPVCNSASKASQAEDDGSLMRDEQFDEANIDWDFLSDS